MERLGRTTFIVLSTVVLVVQLITNSVMAQGPNTSSAQNNETLRIVDSENNTIAIIDPKTDQIVNVSNLTGNAPSEILKPENTTINQTLTTK